MTGITNELMLEGWGGRVKDQVFSVKRKRAGRCRESLGKNESLSLAAAEGPKGWKGSKGWD